MNILNLILNSMITIYKKSIRILKAIPDILMSLLLLIIVKFVSFLWELIMHPFLFFKRMFFWKIYLHIVPFKVLGVYELENEKIYIKFLLTKWVLKPSIKSLNRDIDSVMKIKIVLYNAIRFGIINEESYNLISSSVKECGKYAWELNISLLESMTFHFLEFKSIVIKMLEDSSGRVRETALLVIEDGNFHIDEKKIYYTKMLYDKNKKVRSRALDMFFREGKKIIYDNKLTFENMYLIETDSNIKQQLERYLKITNPVI